MTLADVFTETQEIFETDKPKFLKAGEKGISLELLVAVANTLDPYNPISVTKYRLDPSPSYVWEIPSSTAKP